MSTYAYSHDEARRQARNRALTIAIPMAFVAVALVVLSYVSNPKAAVDTLLSTGLIVLGIGALVTFLQVRSIGKSIASLEITIEPDEITKSQIGADDLTIGRSDVREIVDIPGQGLRVDSVIPGEFIMVPKELEGFDQIKAELFQWRPPVVKTNDIARFAWVFLASAVLFGVLVVFQPTRTYGIALFAIATAGSFIASLVQSVRKTLVRKKLHERETLYQDVKQANAGSLRQPNAEGSAWTKFRTFMEARSFWLGFVIVVVIPGLLVIAAVNWIGQRSTSGLRPKEHAEQSAMAGNFERAEREFREILREKPLDIEVHRDYLGAHFSQSKVKGQNNYRDDKGITGYYTQLSGSDNSEIRDIGFYGLGLIHSFLDEHEEAVKAFTKIGNQHLPYYNNSYGYCLQRLGNTDSAEHEYWREIQYGNNRRGAVLNLALLYDNQRRYEKVKELLADDSLSVFVPENVHRATFLSDGDYGRYAGLLITGILSRSTVDGLIAGFFILAIWFLYFVRIDIFEPEQLRFLLLTLAFGMMASFLCTLLYDWFDYGLGFRMSETWRGQLLYFVFAVGVIEETVKIIPLLLLRRYTKLLNEPVDYLIYGSISALGFAFMENLLYFGPTGVSAISGRALTAVVAHMALTSFVAYGLMLNGRQPATGSRHRPTVAWFAGACLAHGAYDFLLSGRGPLEYLTVFGVFLLLYLVIAFGRMINNALNISTFFSENDTPKLNNIARFLVYSLSYVFLVQYVVVAIRYGSDNANLSLLRSIVGSVGLILIITASLSRFRLEKDRVLPLFEQTKGRRRNPKGSP